MKCVIPGSNIRVFGRAIHSLSKIGDELYMEPLEHGLSLRTVNSSRSAFACFVFSPAFFLHYSDSPGNVTNEGDQEEEEVVKCKIGMKSCLSVFKSLATLEKTVDKCKVTMNMKDSRLVFQMYCRHGIVKTHNLAFIECETLQAVFSKDFSPNVLTAQSRLLADVVVNFQTNQEEISLNVNPEKVKVKNYTEDEPDPQKVIHTELSLDPEEFDGFQVGVDTEITFCLKELRAILAFSESSNYPLSLNFETAGKPVILSIDSDPSFEANFVLATLADRNSQVSCSQQSTQQSISQTTINRTSHQTTSRNLHRTSSATSAHKTVNRRPSTDRQIEERMTNGHREQNTVQKNTKEQSRKQRISKAKQLKSICDELDDDVTHITTNQNKPSTSTSNQNIDNIPANLNKPSVSAVANQELQDRLGGGSDDVSPVIPVQGSSSKAMDISHVSDVEVNTEGEEEEEELIPGTPPAKKFRSTVFFNISQSQTSAQGSQPPKKPAAFNKSTTQSHTVLAEDSEEED